MIQKLKILKQNKTHKPKGGHTNMRTHMKKLVGLASGWLLALGLLVMNSAPVHADYDTANDSAAIVIRIRPNVDRSVTISTGDVGMDLGYVGMGNSTWTIHPATVTIGGSIGNTELNLSADITGGWVFNSFQTYESTAGSENQLNAWVQFAGVSTGIAPAQDNEYFRVGTTSGTKILATGPVMLGTPVGLAGSSGIGRFENNASNTGPTPADMDSMNPVSVRHMFTYFTLPPLTTTSTDQDIHFTLTVRQGP